MRSEPDFAASTIDIIPYGDKVWQLTKPEDWITPWVKIRWHGQVGWVYAPFLSAEKVEPLQAIVSKPPSQSLLYGTWYIYDPFCLEEKKFPGNTYSGKSTIYYFDQKGNYSELRYEGSADGSYTISGSKISIQGQEGYEQMVDFSKEWDVSFYQIRADWLIMEVMTWRTDSNKVDRYLYVFFLIKPISSQS